MANNPTWKRWHEVVQLRKELKTGDLPLNIFAADLYDVVMENARPIYQDPGEFFSFTYPSPNLRELAKDVVLRLAGKNDKAVRQLELTYGGGKTHTLITLYHLTHRPELLPDIPTVRDFIQYIGIMPPQARIAVLPFDKLDVEKGMEVLSPTGERRRLEYPWSILAFQLAGSDGLRLLHGKEEDAERDTPPAENILVDLLSIPVQQGLPVLILIDEVLMYVRQKVGQHVELAWVWRNRLMDFFQCLTQAATKVNGCAIVASLLATDPRKSDELGKELMQELSTVLRREREESIQPIGKEDVAEVLRRRFFTPESIADRTIFRAHAFAALQGIAALDEQTKRDMRTLEKRFVESYPFHPDLTDIFFTKWTNLEGFQRTRGILRTFALALRDAETWDKCPLISTNVFIGEPERLALSESARELTTVAETEEYGGKRQDWSGILEGELAKARDIQTELPALRYREVEQAVFATFLHSQPIGMRSDASTRELLILLGHTHPDRIEIEKALHRWTEVSWFLDEGSLQNIEVSQSGTRQLPKSWRLGFRPNLRQMHHDACIRIADEAVEEYLSNAIRNCKSLTRDAAAAGARVHMLPERPKDIEDDGDFHYAILGPKAASRAGSPSVEARRFLDERTGPDSPRVYRNAVVLAVPSIEGMAAARNAIRAYLGWLDVEERLKGQDVDINRKTMLESEKKKAASTVADLVRQAYCIVVTVSNRNEVQAFRVIVGDEPLFTIIKKDPQSRIQESRVTADTLLPGGPYDLWREGETARRLKDLVEAFAQFSRLPKMLKRGAILDTLLDGCESGLFVFRLPRPEGTYKTFWRERPDELVLKDPTLEVVLPETITLTSLPTSLLLPGALPELWHGAELTLRELYDYFACGRVLTIQRREPGGSEYPDEIAIPAAERSAIDTAIEEAVKEKRLWLISGTGSFLAEDLPAGILTDDAYVQLPPQPIAPAEILPENLVEAWPGEVTTAQAIADALSTKAGKTLPWVTIREAIDGAIRARMLEYTIDSGPWPCDYMGARAVKLTVYAPQEKHASPVPPVPPPKVQEERPRTLAAAGAFLDGEEIQSLSDQIGDLMIATVGLNLTFYVRVELAAGANQQIPEETIAKVNTLLAEVSDKLKLRQE
jgi:hypothetical protein